LVWFHQATNLSAAKSLKCKGLWLTLLWDTRTHSRSLGCVLERSIVDYESSPGIVMIVLKRLIGDIRLLLRKEMTMWQE